MLPQNRAFSSCAKTLQLVGRNFAVFFQSLASHGSCPEPVNNSVTLTLFPASPDEQSVRFFTVIFFVVSVFVTNLAMAESHPSWWGFASPDATAMVGIRWETLHGSAFGEPIEAELFGSLGFPDLAIIRDSRQMLISSPATIAILTGNFPVETLRAQSAAKGLKRSGYKGVELWISPGKTLSIAQMNDQLVLIGARRTLEAAIDRNLAETGTSRRYSPLLARGARFAQKDLWVVSSRLPDPLASLFIPLETEARGFEGGVSVRDGVQLDASLDAGSEDMAAIIAENIRQTIPGLPEVARGMKVVAEADHVLLTMDVSRAQLVAGLRQQEQPAAPVSAAPPDPPIPAGPQVIRIFGLDEGTREIVLPPVKPEKQ